MAGVVKNRDHRVQGHTAGTHERGADEERPRQQVGKEQPADSPAQPLHRAFDQCFTRRQLPPGQSLGDDEFEKRAGGDGPQDVQPEKTAGEARRGQVAGPNSGGGDQKPRADYGKLIGFVGRAH